MNFVVSQSPGLRMRGFSLIESLVAMAIFSLGVLGMIGMYSTAVGTASDSQFRAEAAAYANELMGTIWSTVPRPVTSNYDIDLVTLAQFQSNAGGTDCGSFSGIASLHPAVAAWKARLNAASTGLPKAGLDAYHQIVVDSTAGMYNSVRITLCWQGPRDANPHRYELVNFLN